MLGSHLQQRFTSQSLPTQKVRSLSAPTGVDEALQKKIERYRLPRKWQPQTNCNHVWMSCAAYFWQQHYSSVNLTMQKLGFQPQEHKSHYELLFTNGWWPIRSLRSAKRKQMHVFKDHWDLPRPCGSQTTEVAMTCWPQNWSSSSTLPQGVLTRTVTDVSANLSAKKIGFGNNCSDTDVSPRIAQSG